VSGKNLSATDPTHYNNKAILCPNTEVHHINEELLNYLAGEDETYLRICSTEFKK